ncbi:hypothetical protein GEMRC1_008350 [Eukaryota sp. GEM-RC1]
MSRPSVLKFSGHKYFDLRICAAVLSHRPVSIDHIREDDDSPGLTDGEVMLLRLIERLTNNTTVRINITGTRVFVKPGIIAGGSFTFDTKLYRGLGYYIPTILLLSAFAKQPTEVVLHGITDGFDDCPPVDYFSQTLIPIFHAFGITDASITVNNRGFPPSGGGEVIVRSKQVRSLRNVLWEKPRGKIVSVRGTVTAARISPAVPSRLISESRNVLGVKYPDTYISTNHVKGVEAGKSPGASIFLVAESKRGSLVSTWGSLNPGEVPEDLAAQTCKKLRGLVKDGGLVDSHCQPWLFYLMLMAPAARSCIRLGHVSRRGLQIVKMTQEVFGVNFSVVQHEDHVLVSAVGLGLPNYSRISH